MRCLNYNELDRYPAKCYIDEHGEEGGSNSAVECQLPKLDVAGSIPVSRS